MDFIKRLPKSEGADTIFVVVDRLTKFAHFLPLRHPFAVVQVALPLWSHVIKLHGEPLCIVSDRERIFAGAIWRTLLTSIGTKLSYSTTYHPQTDGQTEWVNQCLEMYLPCAIQDQPKL